MEPKNSTLCFAEATDQAHNNPSSDTFHSTTYPPQGARKSSPEVCCRKKPPPSAKHRKDSKRRKFRQTRQNFAPIDWMADLVAKERTAHCFPFAVTALGAHFRASFKGNGTENNGRRWWLSPSAWPCFPNHRLVTPLFVLSLYSDGECTRANFIKRTKLRMAVL
ncbi:hypothetical protein AVEN_274070-1 [Araneus ventricosus]|uniref:Uncharacterized protein n=1 Tax=Araneus ventricosus TaxID=182803 RepID=A0A4Y2PJK1_ARAVE|nr:hypothetical protein AVEN_274070-1 [Araneus ventricosus]